MPQLDFDGARGGIVDKRPVVRDEHHGIGAGGDEGFEPLDGFDIEVVSRLVEEKHVGAAQKELGQLDAHAPSAAELARRPVEILPSEPQT